MGKTYKNKMKEKDFYKPTRDDGTVYDTIYEFCYNRGSYKYFRRRINNNFEGSFLSRATIRKMKDWENDY